MSDASASTSVTTLPKTDMEPNLFPAEFRMMSSPVAVTVKRPATVKIPVSLTPAPPPVDVRLRLPVATALVIFVAPSLSVSAMFVPFTNVIEPAKVEVEESRVIGLPAAERLVVVPTVTTPESVIAPLEVTVKELPAFVVKRSVALFSMMLTSPPALVWMEPKLFEPPVSVMFLAAVVA